MPMPPEPEPEPEPPMPESMSAPVAPRPMPGFADEPCSCFVAWTQEVECSLPGVNCQSIRSSSAAAAAGCQSQASYEALYWGAEASLLERGYPAGGAESAASTREICVGGLTEAPIDRYPVESYMTADCLCIVSDIICERLIQTSFSCL